MNSNSDNKQNFPGYVKFNFEANDLPYVAPPNEERTDLVLKTIESDKLPYNEHYKDENIIKKFSSKFTQGNRLPTVQLLLRADHVPPAEILKKGGFQPHAFKDGKYPSITYHLLDPTSHSISSERSGMVSCTYSMSMTKEYNNYTPNTYIYLVKAAGGFSGTNFRDVECEVTVPGGIDAEDIVAFRKLHGRGDPSIFDPNEPLYVRESFLRRYPALLDYIFHRYKESNETCPQVQKIMIELVDKEKNHLPATTSLIDIQDKILQTLNEFIENPGISKIHIPRAQAVINAIRLTKSLDDIWYILTNQYNLFKNSTPEIPEGRIAVFGLTAKFYSDQHVNKNECGDYVNTIDKILKFLPLENPLTNDKVDENIDNMQSIKEDEARKAEEEQKERERKKEMVVAAQKRKDEHWIDEVNIFIIIILKLKQHK